MTMDIKAARQMKAECENKIRLIIGEWELLSGGRVKAVVLEHGKIQGADGTRKVRTVGVSLLAEL